MKLSTWLILGGAAAGAVFLVNQTNTPAKAPTPTPTGPKVPSNLFDLMLNAYNGYQRQHGRYPSDRTTWVAVMQTEVAPYSSTVWGYLFDQGIGYIARYGKAADETTQEGWLVQALTMAGG